MSCGSSGIIRTASVRTAVFNPDSEKFASGCPNIGRGKANRFGSPLAAVALDLGSAGIGQRQHFCHFVESFAHRVVDRGTEPDIFADADHGDDLGVTAGGEEQAIGKVERVGQPRRQRMGLEVIDRNQRRIVHHRNGFREVVRPTITPPIRPGPAAAATADNCAKPTPASCIARADDAVQQLDMGAGRDLRHHAAEAGVLGDL